MTIISAENYEIDFHDGVWRLLPTETSLTGAPAFWIVRGGGVMEYTPEFGESQNLPGTILSLEFVRAVVIGYDDDTHRWRLGLHIAQTAKEKPRWVELVFWPAGNNELYANAVQHAGRELAQHLGSPLKIFGAKKLPQTSQSAPKHSGVTGPLVPHQREDISAERVRLFAHSVKLPVQYPGIWLGEGRDGITLKLAKDTAPKQGGEVPAFNQCVIDAEQGKIRLTPPTGLLGIFLGGPQGRVIETRQVRNVELRHVIAHQYHARQDRKDASMVTEVTYTYYTWGVYLTLPDESLLLAQTDHSTSSELMHKRATVGDKFSVDTKAGIEYLRQHQEDQEAYETAENFARTIAIVIANKLGTHLVKTQVENT